MADELIDAVFTGGTVETRVRGAFIDIRQTSSIKVSTRTFATKSVNEIHTNTAICTRIGGAFVDVGLAMLTRVSRNTFARISKIKAVIY